MSYSALAETNFIKIKILKIDSNIKQSKICYSLFKNEGEWERQEQIKTNCVDSHDDQIQLEVSNFESDTVAISVFHDTGKPNGVLDTLYGIGIPTEGFGLSKINICYPNEEPKWKDVSIKLRKNTENSIPIRMFYPTDMTSMCSIKKNSIELTEIHDNSFTQGQN